MHEVKGILFAGELLALVLAAGCTAYLFFSTVALSIAFLGVFSLLFAIYLSTVRNGLKD